MPSTASTAISTSREMLTASVTDRETPAAALDVSAHAEMWRGKIGVHNPTVCCLVVEVKGNRGRNNLSANRDSVVLTCGSFGLLP